MMMICSYMFYLRLVLATGGARRFEHYSERVIILDNMSQKWSVCIL